MNDDLTFDRLPYHGLTVSAHAKRLYLRARSLWPELPIAFDLTFNDANSGGAMRFYEHSIKVWIKLPSESNSYTLAHELAHIVGEGEEAGPWLNPESPKGQERAILSDLINIPGHAKVHALLSDFGFDTSEENIKKSRNFLRSVASAHLAVNGSNLHLSIGYAMMASVHRCESIFDDIKSATRRRSSHVADLGESLANYANSDRNTSLYQDAVELMKIARVSSSFQACVMSAQEFTRRYGFPLRRTRT